MKTIKTFVIPVNRPSSITMATKDKSLTLNSLPTDRSSIAVPVHFYRVIIDGNDNIGWCVDVNNGEPELINNFDKNHDCYKIIATTDKSIIDNDITMIPVDTVKKIIVNRGGTVSNSKISTISAGQHYTDLR